MHHALRTLFRPNPTYTWRGVSIAYQDVAMPLLYDYRGPERHHLVSTYAWAIPSAKALKTIASHAPIIEMGAGGGYWAYLLRQGGVDIEAYDKAPGNNAWVENLWTPVKTGDATMAGEYPHRTLLLIWPPYNTPMGYEALKSYLDAGGTTLIYVGESAYGCNANHEFFELLDENMEQSEEVGIPQWQGIHDYLSVYHAKS